MTAIDDTAAGERFRQLRRERGVTLKQAAGDICSPATLSNFENGKSQLTAGDMVALLARLQLDWALFAPGDTGMPPAFHQACQAMMTHRNFLTWETFAQQMAQADAVRPPADRAGVFVARLSGHYFYPDLVPLAASDTARAADYLLRMDRWGECDMILAALLANVQPALMPMIEHELRQAVAGSSVVPAAGETILRTQLALTHGQRGEFVDAQALLHGRVPTGMLPAALVRLTALALTVWRTPPAAAAGAARQQFRQLGRALVLSGMSGYLTAFLEWNDLTAMLVPQATEVRDHDDRPEEPSLGTLLQRWRRADHLGLADISRGITSKAAVSRFENDQGRLSAPAFWQLLDRLRPDFATLQEDSERNAGTNFYAAMVPTLAKISAQDPAGWSELAALYAAAEHGYAQTGLFYYRLHYAVLLAVTGIAVIPTPPAQRTLTAGTQSYFDHLTYFSTADLAALTLLMPWYATAPVGRYLMTAAITETPPADQRDHALWFALARLLHLAVCRGETSTVKKMMTLSEQIDWPWDAGLPRVLMTYSQLEARLAHGEKQAAADMAALLTGLTVLDPALGGDAAPSLADPHSGGTSAAPRCCGGAPAVLSTAPSWFL